LTGAKGSVRSIEFAPPSPAFGLRVVSSPRSPVFIREKELNNQASVSTDSHLRIHSSLDPNLNDWSLSNSVYIPSLVLAGSSDAANAEAVTISPTTTDELATGGWGLSWCKERWWGSVLAVFAGTSPVVKVSFAPRDFQVIS
jgi:nucleoporin SEH1